MWSFIINLTLIINFIHCAHIETPENDQLQNSEQQRAKPDYFERVLERSKNIRKALQQPSRKELVNEKLMRKRCDACKESIRCKSQGKCDICIRLCKDFEAPPNEAAFVGSQQIVEEIPTTQRSEPSRYYTHGSFRHGQQHNLLARLLDGVQQDNLVKATGKNDNEDRKQPGIINTDKQAQPEVDAQQSVSELTSKIDREMEKLIKRKQSAFGESELTAKEVDKVIDRILAKHNANVAKDNQVVYIGSRGNTGDSLHITTKRSITNWESSKNKGHVVGTRELLNSQPETQENENPQDPNFSETQALVREPQEAPNGSGFINTEREYQNVSGEEAPEQPQAINQFAENVGQPQVSGKSKNEEHAEAILTLPHNPTQSEESLEEDKDQTLNDPVVGKSWLNSEMDKAKTWWKENVRLEQPKNLTNIEVRDVSQNQTQETGNKTNFINANHFVSILKNLEQKVENIANLVKKTCGTFHSEEDETVGEKQPTPKVNNNRKQQVLGASLNLTPTRSPMTLGNRMKIIDAASNEDSNNAITIGPQTEQFTTIPTANIEKASPKVIEKVVDTLHKDTNILINKALDIAQSLQEDLHPKQNLDKPLSQTQGHGDAVGCSKEESGEYVGDSQTNPNSDKVKDPIVACSKEDSEYVGEKSQDVTNPELAAKSDKAIDPIVACSKEDSEEYVGEKLQDVTNPELEAKSGVEKDQNIINKAADSQPKSEENVECKKEESEEYVGDAQKPTKEDASKPMTNPENVGCSKESAEEYVGEQQNNNSQVSEPIASIKPIDTKGTSGVIKETTNNQEEVGCSKEQSEEYVGEPKKDGLDVNGPQGEEAVGCSKEKESEEEYLPPYGSNYRNSENKSNKPKQSFGIPEHIEQPSPNHKADESIHKNPIYPKIPSITKPEVNSVNHEVPKLYQQPSSPSKVMQPALNQRFAEQPAVVGAAHSGSENIEIHTIPNENNESNPVTNPDKVVGVKNDLSNDDFQHTPNPYSIFGKFVPQLSNTDLSGNRPVNNKVYFVGTGMQLPLNMKQHQDGSYQLSVDLDKLCDNCNDKQCKKKNGNEEVVGLQQPTPEISPNVKDNQIKNVAKEIGNPEEQRETKQNGKRQMDNRLFQQGFGHQASLSDGLYNQQMHPRIFKRSANMLQFPSNAPFESAAKPQIVFDKDDQSPPQYHPKELGYFDESLNKIDKNMQRYFDRRQKLEKFYKTQNKNSFENPGTEKDVVKRRITLVNNVLTWMKNVAAPHS